LEDPKRGLNLPEDVRFARLAIEGWVCGFAYIKLWTFIESILVRAEAKENKTE
jgi:hypothetical protein